MFTSEDRARFESTKFRNGIADVRRQMEALQQQGYDLGDLLDGLDELEEMAGYVDRIATHCNLMMAYQELPVDASLDSVRPLAETAQSLKDLIEYIEKERSNG